MRFQSGSSRSWISIRHPRVPLRVRVRRLLLAHLHVAMLNFNFKPCHRQWDSVQDVDVILSLMFFPFLHLVQRLTPGEGEGGVHAMRCPQVLQRATLSDQTSCTSRVYRCMSALTPRGYHLGAVGGEFGGEINDNNVVGGGHPFGCWDQATRFVVLDEGCRMNTSLPWRWKRKRSTSSW